MAGGKLALYDEVFGYFLDVPYMWANPPHSLVIPYDTLNDGKSYAEALKQLGFTHIYISTSSIVKDPAFVQKWIAAMGLQAPPVPFAPDEKKAMMDNYENRWMPLLSDAVAEHLVVPVQGYKHGILFKIQ